MKIAYLYPRYLTNDGGAEVGLTRIVEELARRGHEITVIAASPLESDRSFEREPCGCRVVALPRSVWRERALQFLDSIQYRRGGYRLTRFLARRGQLWRKLLLLGKGACCPSLGRRSLYEPYDLVVNYCTTHTSWGIAFDRVLPRLKDKAVCAVTMSHFHEQVETADVLRTAHRRYDGIEAHTEYERDVLGQRGWDASRIFVTGVGSDPYDRPVDPPAFRKSYHIPADAPLIVFVGRKVYLKGVTHLIEAMESVWARHPAARLALLGFSHNPRAWIDDCLGKSRFDAVSKTINLDDVSEQTREEALAACNVFAMPSAGESFGIAFLDAWRYSKPVIACRDTCSQSLVSDGEDGLLVGYENVAELGQALLRLLSDPALAGKLGRNGFAKWNHQYRWEQVAEVTERGFEALVRRKRESAAGDVRP